MSTAVSVDVMAERPSDSKTYNLTSIRFEGSEILKDQRNGVDEDIFGLGRGLGVNREEVETRVSE